MSVAQLDLVSETIEILGKPSRVQSVDFVDVEKL